MVNCLTLLPQPECTVPVWEKISVPTGACLPLILLQCCQNEFRRHGGSPGDGRPIYSWVLLLLDLAVNRVSILYVKLLC
jgi:hypothetical protein